MYCVNVCVYVCVGMCVCVCVCKGHRHTTVASNVYITITHF